MVTWVTILIQLLFPLSLSFTPVIAATGLLPEKSTVIHVDTEPYRLGTHETVESVAKKYAISVDELKRINIYRTFAKPFTALTVGDEIDVPRKKSPFTVDNNASVPVENSLASNAATGAALLSHGDTAKSAENMARSAVNNEISSSAQQWLGQFGTARVQFNTNDDFEFDSSAIDVLIPLYDNQKSLLFTQLGGRNKDSRNTINIGAGVRAFLNDWMYGANTFFDNDITGNNRRVGIGAEAWTDYLKLSANGYFGTTDWHQSRDFADYNERPANGYDLRAEAYLPVYPQLGGKLMYEQYHGDEVALFGKDKRQKDPHAITAGISYTPVSLVTVGIDHRAGKSSKSDSSINIQFNYRLSNSWQSHIDPSAVAATRTLAGSRHDLVERNNNIVLDYQKQELIRLALTPAQVTAEASSTVVVSAQVTSKYAFERIEWDSAALIAAGGTLTQISPQSAEVKLPPYQLTRSSSNIHLLSAVAYDNQGNASNRDTVQVTVIPSAATITSENLTVTTDGAIANGSATNAVQALVTDVDNNPVSEQVVTFSADNGATVTTVIGTTGADGIATATLTNTTAGVSNVTATVNGSGQTKPTTFIADDATAQIMAGNLTLTVDDAIANGSATNAVQAIVTDANSNPLSVQVVTFSAGNGATVTTVIGTTGADGIATASLTNTAAGISAVTATLSNNANQTVDTTFVSDGGTAVINDADFTVDTGALADNTATNALSATVKDVNGNVVPNVVVTFAVTVGSATLSSATATTDVNGVATATLKSTVAETNQVTASVRGTATAAKPSAFVAPPAFTGITVNGHDFAITDGFPTTGFIGAEFTLNVTGSPTDYNWTSSDTSWVSVDSNGKVSFTAEGNSTPVTITATPNGGEVAQTYTFAPSLWFSYASGPVSWPSAASICTGSLRVPSIADLKSDAPRMVGGLWTEWGDLQQFSTASFTPGIQYWMKEEVRPGVNYFFNVINGFSGSTEPVSPKYVFCAKSV
ncbi:YrIlm family inverse autotransporter adhesin [Yersinia aldovae]|uniref:YrIlm family inverse autotransporter adhesin n=1 Tax=Yersinia aldovae TaxID=29483 RepID=UPI0028F45736|nr:YrIlm family inverse autotransporter adhesin [Yersinia aldovae]